MEPAQAKPLRRRRRWLIVTVVLVLLASVAWWYYPRGDARFVGKWAMINRRGYRGETIQFFANGRCTLRDQEITDSFRWSIEDGRLCFGPPPFSGFESSLQAGVEQLVMLAKDTYPREKHFVSSEMGSEIHLLDVSTGEERLILRRIPE